MGPLGFRSSFIFSSGSSTHYLHTDEEWNEEYSDSDWDPDAFFTQWNTDEDHELHDYACTCLTESGLETGDLAVCDYDSEFSTTYSQYVEARDALKQARVACGFYPVVTP